MKRSSKWIVILIPLLLVVPLVLAQSAQTGLTIEFVGIVQTINPTSVTVSGQPIDTSAAVLRSPLAVGMAVKVEGILMPNGSITANTIERGLLPGQAEIVGSLQGVAGTTMVVNGVPVDISLSQPSTQLPANSQVRIYASLSPDGRWIALEVLPFTDVLAPAQTPEVGAPALTTVPPVVQTQEVAPGGEFEITGPLEQIGDGFIVVSGQAISIIGAEIRDALTPGMIVKVHLSAVNGQLVAREVENAADDDNDDDGNSGSGSSGSGGGDDDDDNGNSGSGGGGDDDD
jgi:hypothetical protein